MRKFTSPSQPHGEAQSGRSTIPWIHVYFSASIENLFTYSSNALCVFHTSNFFCELLPYRKPLLNTLGLWDLPSPYFSSRLFDFWQISCFLMSFILNLHKSPSISYEWFPQLQCGWGSEVIPYTSASYDPLKLVSNRHQTLIYLERVSKANMRECMDLWSPPSLPEWNY